jgi:hypothetical protein
LDLLFALLSMLVAVGILLAVGITMWRDGD